MVNSTYSICCLLTVLQGVYQKMGLLSLQTFPESSGKQLKQMTESSGKHLPDALDLCLRQLIMRGTNKWTVSSGGGAAGAGGLGGAGGG